MQFDETADDREAEPQSALGAINRLRFLREQVEHPRKHLGLDADAAVADFEHHAIAGARAANR